MPLTQPKWKTQALSSGRVVEIALDLQEVPKLACNAAEVREIAVNLIFNAVDAMPQGGTITLRTHCDDSFVRIGISDTGLGMTEEVRHRCMEPFFSTKGENGTGLGLAMVFGIAKRHDGRVEIESELGKGTTIWISLSTKLAEMETDEGDETAIDRSLRILAVDDEDVARDIVSRYLSADGHRVTVATEAQEALERFDADKYDLVITDQAMPGMTGAELATAIRARIPGQPILVLTGWGGVARDSIELPAGVEVIGSKAISQSELRSAVARTMRRFLTSPRSSSSSPANGKAPQAKIEAAREGEHEESDTEQSA